MHQLDTENISHLDPLEVSDIMTTANIPREAIDDPAKMGKLGEIIEFFQGKEDKSFMIRKLLSGKNVEPIDHLHQYINLRKQYSDISGKYNQLKEELSLFE